MKTITLPLLIAASLAGCTVAAPDVTRGPSASAEAATIACAAERGAHCASAQEQPMVGKISKMPRAMGRLALRLF